MSKDQVKKTTTTVGGEYHLPLSRQQVWWSLNDPSILKRCIRGCDRVWRDEEGRFHAEFSFRLGPVRKMFVAHLDVEETAPPARYDLLASMKTGKVGGAGGRAMVHLERIAGGTTLSYSADVEIEGWLAVMGEQALSLAADKTMKLFFDRFVEAAV